MCTHHMWDTHWYVCCTDCDVVTTLCWRCEVSATELYQHGLQIKLHHIFWEITHTDVKILTNFLMWKPPKIRPAAYLSMLATITLNNLWWKSWCWTADGLLMLPDKHPELCFVPAGSRVGAGVLAPFREGHVPRLLLQERAVEETEVAELGQRGEFSSQEGNS